MTDKPMIMHDRAQGISCHGLPARGRVGRAANAVPEHGFTLVELIVVIGIIAILTAIMLPAVARVREKSAEVRCTATLYSIGHAALLHAQEHGNYLPAAGWHRNCVDGLCDPDGLQDGARKKYDYYADSGMTRPLPVTVALGLYLGVRCRTDSREHLTEDMAGESLQRLFRCPSDQIGYQAWTQRSDEGWTAPEEVSSYTFNEALLGRRGYITPNCPKANLSKVRDTTRVFFAMDGRPRDQGGNHAFLIPDDNPGETLSDVQQFLLTFEPNRGREALDFTRHRLRINVVYCDGHAESLSMGLPSAGGEELKDVYVSRGIAY
jgi:prepilin-type N-terminal cleavage/methylation domain-containing protein/prepilin-type processing-associated H-X9-DG protein